MRLRVGIVGTGLIGGKRASALSADDELIGVHDLDPDRARDFAATYDASPYADLSGLLAQEPDVVVVATTHDALRSISCRALDAGAHVLVEKPAGLSIRDVDAISMAAGRARRLVKVGFNHRFHPAIRRAIDEARSGRFGRVMFMRARYGHGGRLGYEKEWRADASRSGGGELIDQGMHLIDLSNALHGNLPLHSALVHTDYWAMNVDDNAVITLAAPGQSGPWTTFHVSCSEWKNLFELEIYTTKAKWHVSGLSGSYGPQVLRIFHMRPEMGPPDVTEIPPPDGDPSWHLEWEHFRHALEAGTDTSMAGTLADARYAHAIVHAAYRESASLDMPKQATTPRHP